MTFNKKAVEAGDHLVTDRMGYTHHGIYLGGRKVIHYSGFSDGFRAGAVEITDINTFTQGNRTYVHPHTNRKFSHKATIKRARERLHEDRYNLVLNNCEHFINWCIYGKARSQQVTKAVMYVLSAGMMGSRAGSFDIFGLGLTAFARRTKPLRL